LKKYYFPDGTEFSDINQYL